MVLEEDLGDRVEPTCSLPYDPNSLFSRVQEGRKLEGLTYGRVCPADAGQQDHGSVSRGCAGGGEGEEAADGREAEMPSTAGGPGTIEGRTVAGSIYGLACCCH